MKKAIVMVVATLMATLTVHAQNSELKNEIGVSYGAGLSLIGDGLGNGIGRGLLEIGSGVYKWENEKQFGSLSVEFFHHLSIPKLAVGAIASYSRCGEDIVSQKDNVKAGDRTRNYISLMPAVKYSWINKEHFALYSKVAAGATLLSETGKNTVQSFDDSKLYFAFQVSALGIEFGGKLRAFIEAGAGEQGFGLAGLKYKF